MPTTMAFTLPPGWYVSTVERLVDELQPVLGDLTPQTAWKFVVALVMWADEIGGTPYLHLNDRLTSRAGKDLATRGLAYLDEHFTPSQNPLDYIDQIGTAYAAERASQGYTAAWQRNNVTGRSFETVLQVLIGRLSGFTPQREPQLRTLRGFELAPVGYHSQPDLVLFSARDFRLLISTKWTLRKERIGTYLHEAYFYRQRRSDLQVAFVVSEFNPNILEWLVGDPLVDRVYHVNRDMLLAVHNPFLGAEELAVDKLTSPSAERRRYERWLGLGARLFDLADLFADIAKLDPSVPTAVEPDDAGTDADDDRDLAL